MADVMVREIFGYSAKCTRRIGTNADYTPGGNFNIFQIQNACVVIHEMWGHVTTACTGALLVPQINFTPAGGGGATVFCAAAAGAAHAVDVMLAWSGLVAGVLTPTATLGHSDCLTAATEGFAAGVSLKVVPGIINIINATADATATIDWYVVWSPGAPNAIIVAI